jgi:hypothetical protein
MIENYKNTLETNPNAQNKQKSNNFDINRLNSPFISCVARNKLNELYYINEKLNKLEDNENMKTKRAKIEDLKRKFGSQQKVINSQNNINDAVKNLAPITSRNKNTSNSLKNYIHNKADINNNNADIFKNKKDEIYNILFEIKKSSNKVKHFKTKYYLFPNKNEEPQDFAKYRCTEYTSKNSLKSFTEKPKNQVTIDLIKNKYS